MGPTELIHCFCSSFMGVLCRAVPPAPQRCTVVLPQPLEPRSVTQSPRLCKAEGHVEMAMLTLWTAALQEPMQIGQPAWVYFSFDQQKTGKPAHQLLGLLISFGCFASVLQVPSSTQISCKLSILLSQGYWDHKWATLLCFSSAYNIPTIHHMAASSRSLMSWYWGRNSENIGSEILALFNFSRAIVYTHKNFSASYTIKIPNYIENNHFLNENKRCLVINEQKIKSPTPLETKEKTQVILPTADLMTTINIQKQNCAFDNKAAFICGWVTADNLY